MSGLNNKNMPLWEGDFNDYPFENVAIDKGPAVFDGNDDILINLILNDVSTYGIDPYSVEVFQIEDSAGNKIDTRPSVWDPVNEQLKLYVPDTVVNDGYIVKYRWRDILGRLSNVGRLYVNHVTRPTDYRGYAPTWACLITSGGANTGYIGFTLLERYYTDTNLTVLPLQTKNNTFGDPDYIAPIQNTNLCPVGNTQTAYLGIKNTTQTAGVNMLITTLVLKVSGQPDVVHTLNLTNGQQQIIAIPSQLYDSIEINYTVNSLNNGGWAYILNLPGAPSTQGTLSYQTGNFVLYSNAIFPTYGGSLLMAF